MKSVTYAPRTHEPCASRGDCFHIRAGRIGGRNQPREAKVRGGSIGGRNGSHEDKVRAGRIGGRNQPREAKVRGGRISARNQPREAKVRGGRNGSHEDKVRAGRIGGPIGARNQPREAKARGGRIGGRINGQKAFESGQLARISRGVESVTEDGIHCDSQTEAIFYGVMTALGGKPTRVTSVILPDGSSYTPDFVLGKSVLGIPANVPIELKPSRKMFSRFNTTVKKAKIIGAVIVYADELWD